MVNNLMKKALLLGGGLVVLILIVMWSQGEPAGVVLDDSSDAVDTSEEADFSANFTFELGNFGAYFPMPPSYVPGNMPLKEGGSIETHLYQYEAPDASLWQAGFAEYPETSDLSDVEGSLANSVETTRAAFEGEVVSLENTTYQGFPAVDYLISVQGGVGYFKGRNILNGHRFYTVGYAYDAGAEVASDHFFNSLVIN